MADSTYFERLADRALQARIEDLAELQDAVVNLLAEQDQLSPGQVPDGQKKEKIRSELQQLTTPDQLQDTLTRALAPSPSVETQIHAQAITDIPNLAARFAKLPRTGWHENAKLFLTRSGKNEPHEIESAKFWHDFLTEDAPLAQEPHSPERGRKTGVSARRLHETVALLRSSAPVIARRVAASFTIKKRLGKIFTDYGFPADRVIAKDRKDAKSDLVSCLDGRDKPCVECGQAFKNWPRAAIAGSFASDLATAVEYPPSVWMLERELENIGRSRAAREKNEKAGETGGANKGTRNENGGSAISVHPRDDAWGMDLLGLCFSGGGIRSATFNLGVLQGLAKLGMLSCIDYISTVSGGGYISSWLMSWIKRESMQEVEARLSPGLVTDPADRRLRPIEGLRQFSNYLTPKTGLLTVDTWVMVVVWLRNTLLNLLILLPALLGVLFLPRLLEVWAHEVALRRCQLPLSACLQQKISLWGDPTFPPWLLSIPILLIVMGCTLIAFNLYNFACGNSDVVLKETHPKKTPMTPWYSRPWWIRNLIVMPALPAAWIITLKLYFRAELLDWSARLVIGGVATALALFMLCIVRYPKCFKKFRGEDSLAYAYAKGVAAMVAIAFILGAVTAFFTLGLDAIFSSRSSGGEGAAAITVWGAPLVVLALFLLVVLLVGLMGRNLPIEGAMWLGRLNTYLAMYGVVWLVWVGIAVYGGRISNQLWAMGRIKFDLIKWPAIALWVWTTLQGVLAGNDSRTRGGKPGDWKTKLGFYATVGPYVFIIGLMLALSFAAEQIFHALEPWIHSKNIPYLSGYPWLFAALAGFLLSVFLVLILSFYLDINELSMNTFYRARLVRCYLGASNKERHPNPFLGFDPKDDEHPLADFKLKKDADPNDTHPYHGPYPLYNATLNLVHGDELAWQERKGASFVFTPDLCGYETPWNATTDPRAFRNLQFLGYRETSNYAYPGGMHLGTPMSISGAAASPNMGSYSQAATSLLMTIFNVRLGWWLGNPRHKRMWKKAGPSQGPAYLLKELLGLTDDRAGFVYLSDGGHFENLGIYGLVRRRCRYIIACDSEEDAQFNFQGLGNAIRKCREDFGVEIDIRVDRIKPDPATGRSRAHCVVGKIYYPDQPGWGYLVYLKSSVVGDEPADVLEFQAKHADFPHQSTGDQWFTESQFESYRRLGLHVATVAFLRPIGDDQKFCKSKNSFFHKVLDRWYPPSDALEKNFTRHAAAYDALVRELRSDHDLRQLDEVLYPRAGVTAVTRLVMIEPDSEKAFLFLTSLFQLMENVYLDLDLESTSGHPDNAGWMAIFGTWAQTDVFKDAWQRCGWTYGRNFQSFCNRLFGLPDSNHN